MVALICLTFIPSEPLQFFNTHEYDRKFRRLTLKLSAKLTIWDCIAIAHMKEIDIPADAGDLDSALYVLSLRETTNEMKESFEVVKWTKDYFKFKNELAILEYILSSIGRHDLIKDHMEKEGKLTYTGLSLPSICKIAINN